MMGALEGAALIEKLEAARAAEKEQALCYRSLAARAEEKASIDAQRFHDLHADEQHHLSRLTARVLELGGHPRDLSGTTTPILQLDDWEGAVHARELVEVDRYRALLAEPLDSITRHLIQEILEVEEHHARELGGKWTMA